MCVNPCRVVSGENYALRDTEPKPFTKKNKKLIQGELLMVTMKDLLECGVHFGHQTRRWNQNEKFIFGVRKIFILLTYKNIKIFQIYIQCCKR